MTDSDSGEDGKVGYKRPPIETRFAKGQSGNPRGRQKGVHNFVTDLKRSLEIPITVKDKGRSKRVSTQRALFMRLRERAFSDNLRALETYLGLARAHNIDKADDGAPGEPMTPGDQAILQSFAEELRSRPAAVVERTPDASQGERGRGDE